MARLYDAIEPEVVSMDMLQRAVESLRADADNLVPKSEKLDYSEVDTIRLDFRSEMKCSTFVLVKTILFCLFIADILRMENLWLLTNLTKLQMDNNIIEKIEGLDTLTHLTWLGEKTMTNTN